MGKVNVTKIGIYNTHICLEQRLLFAIDSSGGECSSVCEISSLELQDIGIQTKELYSQSLVDIQRDSTYLKSEEIYHGKAIIKNYRDEKFVIDFSGKKYLIGPASFKLLSPKTLFLIMDGYALSLFLYCFRISQRFVELISYNLSHKWYTMCKQQSGGLQLSKLKIELKQPERHVMDLTWAKMTCTTIHELRQLQYAMSWLSTLGGAFSALGEEQERCAKAAGAISVEQLRIALKLGDNIVITQCKLYFSLSLIQRGYCQLAKKIILEQYDSLKNSFVIDRKTMNMCKGIWTRLKYEIQKRRKVKVNVDKVSLKSHC